MPFRYIALALVTGINIGLVCAVIRDRQNAEATLHNLKVQRNAFNAHLAAYKAEGAVAEAAV